MTEHDIFREVQEDFERQRLEALWRQYGAWIVTAALVAVLVTGASTAYRSWATERDQRLTGELLTASQAEKDPLKTIDSLQAFAQANPDTDMAALALLRAGALAADKNDKARAIMLFDQVSQTPKAEVPLQQLGDLLSVQTQMDSGDAAALSQRLQPLTFEKGAWRFSAMEDEGYLALKMNDKEKAKKIFTELSQNASVPKSISARATDLLRSFD